MSQGLHVFINLSYSLTSRVCVVYGALPPEMRRQQAKLFNDPDNDYNLMVASDAVGMGLNLNIRRIVFHTLHKLEGRQRTLIPVTQIKQIAGGAPRAGALCACACSEALDSRAVASAPGPRLPGLRVGFAVLL